MSSHPGLTALPTSLPDMPGAGEGKERPIIFSGPMVRAILAGRKTQTRRVIKPPRGVDPNHWMPDAPGPLGAGIYGDRVKVLHWPNDGAEHALARLPCGKGDRLWVRETWQTGSGYAGPQVAYRATEDAHDIDAWDGEDEGAGPSFNYDRLPGLKWHTWLPDLLSGVEGAWRSPIHMPRALSRITLEVTEVRVERLHNISHEDAAAEGLIADRTPAGGILRNVARDECRPIVRTQWQGAPDLPLRGMERAAYRDLWNSIHGKDAWDANPWVAAITFRPVSVPPSGGKALEPLSLHPGDLGLGGGA